MLGILMSIIYFFIKLGLFFLGLFVVATIGLIAVGCASMFIYFVVEGLMDAFIEDREK